MEAYITWLLLYSTASLGLIFGIYLLRKKNKQVASSGIESVSIIIPFRNEATNLPAFISCIKSQAIQPKEWIFVNDHSEDSFETNFSDLDNFSVRLLHLPAGKLGKKEALRFGIDNAQSAYCLTMDADVIFQENYIESIVALPKADLFVLPVYMKSKRWWQTFFQVEYTFTNVLNKGVSGWLRPILCSGANLMFNKNSFKEVDDFENHILQSSGDDIYALRAFRNNNKEILLLEDVRVAVCTQSPDSFLETLNQRTRWAGKSKNVADQLANTSAMFIVLTHLFLMVLFAVNCATSKFWSFFAIVLVCKLFLDSLLVYINLKTFSKKEVLGVFLFEVFYPIYLTVLLPKILFSKPSWKGRK